MTTLMVARGYNTDKEWQPEGIAADVVINLLANLLC
jgi:hypothetical protein